jgi:hypothetical protein
MWYAVVSVVLSAVQQLESFAIKIYNTASRRFNKGLRCSGALYGMFERRAHMPPHRALGV